MKPVSLTVAATLAAHAEDVYSTIADYRHGHPHILPPGKMYDLRVEQGGYGSGTIMRFKARTAGRELSFYHRVSEPEPGRVLVEQDIDGPRQLTTTFTVTPVEDGQKSHVEISTTMNTSPGFMGLMERLFMRMINTPVYQEELKLLEAFAQKAHSMGK